MEKKKIITGGKGISDYILESVGICKGLAVKKVAMISDPNHQNETRKGYQYGGNLFEQDS